MVQKEAEDRGKSNQSRMKRIISLDVPVSGGERLDYFLARNIEGITRAEVQRLIRDGRVTIGNIRPKKSYLVQAGERVEVEVDEWPKIRMIPARTPCRIEVII